MTAIATGEPASITHKQVLVVFSATRRLVTMPSNGGPHAPVVTTTDCDVLARIVAVRRSHLGQAAREWDTGDHDAIALHDIDRELIPDPRPPAS